MKQIFYVLVCVLLSVSNSSFAQKVSSNSPVCEGNKLELKAEGGITYAWKGPDGFVSDQQNPVISNVISKKSGTYTVTVDNKTVLTVEAKIGKVQFSSQTIYNGFDGTRLYLVTYPSNNVSNSPFKYFWTGPNNYISTEQVSNIYGFTKKNDGIYTATMTDEFGCSYKATTEVKVGSSSCLYSATIYIGTDRTSSSYTNSSGESSTNVLAPICKNTTIKLSTDTTYFGKSKVQWFRNNVEMSGVNDLKISVSDAAVYYATITNATCEYQTRKIEVQLYTATNISLTSYSRESNVNICPDGGSAILSANTEFNFFYNTSSYKWLKNDEIIDGATNNSFNATEEGNYRIIYKSDECEAISNVIKVTKSDKIFVKIAFEGSYEFKDPKELKLCSESQQNNSIYILSTGIGNQEIFKNNKLLYNTSYNLGFNANESGVYKVKVTQGKCVATDSVTLTYGKTYTIPLYSYRYTPSTCSNPYNIIYYPVQIPPSGNFQWQKEGSLFSNGTNLFASLPGNYQLKYTNSQTGCTGESKVVKIDKPFERQIFKINSAKSVKLCKGNIHVLRVSNCYSNAIWKKDGKVFSAKPENQCSVTVNETGKYWYEYSNGSCLYYSDSIDVQVLDVPVLTVKDSCLANNIVSLKITAVDGAKYQWIKDDVTIKGANSNSFNSGDYGSYYVQTFKDGCFASSKAIALGIVTKSVHNACQKDTVKLSVSGNVKSFNWAGPNKFISTSQNPFISKATSSMAGVYTVTGTGVNGCVFSAKTKVVINDIPVFSFPKIITACEGSDFEFPFPKSNALTDTTETADYFIWKGPNNTGNQYGVPLLNNVSAKQEGLYTFTGYAANGGCSAIATTTLTLDKSSSCKSITIGDISKLQENPSCGNSMVEIPFKTTGVFAAGTKFKVVFAYAESIVYGEGTTSPIKIKLPNNEERVSLRIITEGNIYSSQKYIPINYNYNKEYYLNYSGGIYTNNEKEFGACDSIRFYINNAGNYKNFKWFLDGKEIANASKFEFQAKKSGTYSLKYDSYNGCSAEIFGPKTTLGLISKPYISGQNEIYCGQDQVKINSYTYAENGTTYAWKRNGVFIAGANNYQLSTNREGKYLSVAQTGSCTAVSDTFEVKKSTLSKLPINISYYGDISCSNPETTIFYNNSIQANEKWQFQWYKNGIEIQPVNINNFYTKEAGTYSLKVNNGVCEGISNEIQVKKTDFTKAIISKNITELCEGSLAYLSLNSPLRYQYYDSSKGEYLRATYSPISWYRDGKLINDVNSTKDDGYYNFQKDDDNVYNSLNYGAYSSMSNKTSGKYYAISKAKYVNGIECTAISDTVTINFSKQVLQQSVYYGYDKTLGAIPVTVCKDTATLYDYNYNNNQRVIQAVWKKDGVVFKSISKLDTLDSSSILTTNLPGNYVYEIRYKGGCVSTSLPYKVTLGKMDVLLYETEAIKSICEGVGTYLNGGVNQNYYDTTKIDYNWLKDGKPITSQLSKYNNFRTKDAGVYKLTAKQGKCEGTSSEVTVKIDKLPTILSPSDSTYYCENATVDLKASNESGLKYQWELDGANVKGANVQTLKAGVTGLYRALLRRGECVDYTSKVKVTANILPKLITISDTLICPNLTSKLNVTPDRIAGILGINYTWEKDGKATTLANTSEVKAQEKGLYRVQFSRGNCVSYSNTVKLNNKDIPTSVSPLDTTFCANGIVELKAQNVANTIYQWEKDEKAIASATNIILKTGEAGKYRLLVKKEDCSVYSKTINVAQKPATTAEISGDKIINYADSSKISLKFTSDSPWTFKLSDGKEYTTTKSPFEVSVKPQFTTIYSVKEVKNICGVGTATGTAKVEVIILSVEEEKGINLEIFPMPASEICNWKIQTDKPTTAQLTLMDVRGIINLEQSSPTRSQNHSGILDLSTIKSGTYFLKIDVGDKTITRKIIKY